MAVSTWYIRMTAIREIFCSSCNLQKKKKIRFNFKVGKLWWWWRMEVVGRGHLDGKEMMDQHLELYMYQLLHTLEHAHTQPPPNLEGFQFINMEIPLHWQYRVQCINKTPYTLLSMHKTVCSSMPIKLYETVCKFMVDKCLSGRPIQTGKTTWLK